MRYLPAVVLVLFASSAAAMEMPGEERFKGLQSPEEKNSAGADAGIGFIDEDLFFTLTLRTALNLGKVGVGLQVPLNLRVWDRPEETDEDYFGILRHEDWDEYGEWLRVIRYVRYGHKHSDDLLFARVGELAADLGHGTIMARYLNNIDSSAFRLGSQFDVYTRWGGLETVVADWSGLTHADHPWSRLVGMRLYVKPLAFVGGGGGSAPAKAGEGGDKQQQEAKDEGGGGVPELFNILAVGMSLVTDLNAPRTLATDADDRLVLEGGRLQTARAGTQTIFGIDAEVQALNLPILKITPYTDLNFIVGAGWGWHAGTLVTVRMPLLIELTIPIRLEYRRFASDYIPAYFSTFYEMERLAFPIGEDGAKPKARYLRELPEGDGLNGYYGDLAFDLQGIVQVGAIYEGYEGSYPNLAAFLAVPALEVVQLKAYYTRVRIADAQDLFGLDERSMLIAQARYQLNSVVGFVAQWSRRWQLVTEAGDDYGTFQPEDDWKVGVELGLEF